MRKKKAGRMRGFRLGSWVHSTRWSQRKGEWSYIEQTPFGMLMVQSEHIEKSVLVFPS